MISSELYTPNEEYEIEKFINSKKMLNDIYLELINEWSKNLFTPEKILKMFLYELFGRKFNGNSIALGLSISELNCILNRDDYKLYPEFSKCIEKYLKEHGEINSYIYVCILVENNLKSYKEALKNTTYFNRCNEIFNSSKSNGFPSAEIFFNCRSLNGNADFFTIAKGCLILINYDSIDPENRNDINYFEKLLDHEFNHYFSILDKRINNVKTTSANDKFKLTLRSLGYDINSKDFENHILKNNEFNSMCSDVCNCIEFHSDKNLSNEENYYKWIEMSTVKFLMSSEFKSLNYEFQKSLIFSYACRSLNKEKWKMLKNDVYVQLNRPKKNIFRSSLNWFKEFFKLI